MAQQIIAAVCGNNERSIGAFSKYGVTLLKIASAKSAEEASHQLLMDAEEIAESEGIPLEILEAVRNNASLFTNILPAIAKKIEP
jgi:hypothetical protein